jgi:hypothetical protein
MTCDYVIDWKIIGDPFMGSLKDYEAQYTCGNSGVTKRAHVDPEAGVGKTIHLLCP